MAKKSTKTKNTKNMKKSKNEDHERKEKRKKQKKEEYADEELDLEEQEKEQEDLEELDEETETESEGEIETEENEKEKLTLKALVPIFIIAILFVISIVFALILAPLYVNMGLQSSFEQIGGEESLWIPLCYIIIIVLFTAVILFITRKRKGRFIKYAFLAVICLSMSYVFWAIFDYTLYPIPDQKWSSEVEIDGGVNTILIADLLGDSDVEIIVGSNDENIYIYDNNYNLLWSTNQPLSNTILDLAVAELNQNSTKDLIVASESITIFEFAGNDDNVELISSWTSVNNDYTFLMEDNSNSVIVGSSSNANPGNLEIIRFYNSTYHLDPINESNSIDFPVVTLQEIMTNFSNIIDIQILNIDEKADAELIIWDNEGTIYIFERDNPREPRWEKDVGNHIGGVAFDDYFPDDEKYFNDDRNEIKKGFEMVVSVDGRVYIYYSIKNDIFNEKFEVTEETGRLDSGATGLSVEDLDNNDEMDILVGHEDGFKQYQYIWHQRSEIPYYLGLIVAIIISIFLFKFPEWYVVDIVGIIVAGGVTALLGISIGLLPIILLLIVLAIYDAISVYKTKHMVSLADKVMEFKLPILLVVPKKRGYSFLRQKGLKKQLDDGEEREAMFIGLGDIIIPGALVISAFHFLPITGGWFGISANLLVAIFTLAGTLVGFSALMHYVLKGNPQAGLPLLNTGAILGFFISNYVIYQDLTFGMMLPFG